MLKTIFLKAVASFFILVMFSPCSNAQTEPNRLINEPVDISPDFHNFVNAYFLADSLTSFDPNTISGTVEWKRNHYVRRMAFNNELAALAPYKILFFLHQNINRIRCFLLAFNLFLHGQSG